MTPQRDEPVDPLSREFTVEEANALLPVLTESLGRIRRARQLVLKGAQPLRRSAARDGGGRQGAEHWEALTELRREIEGLTRNGIVVRDPESGLVDFPSRRQGRPVFLCWRVGEKRVEFWHGPESGFAGRRPL